MPIPSQLSGGDVKILTMIMDFVAARREYTYLEIGSYLGASLQWHLKNPQCTKVVSVDKRSKDKILDERQINYAYNVSTLDMLNTLNENGVSIDKLSTVDGTIDSIFPVEQRFDLIFVDAEHTNTAVLHDGTRCLEAKQPDCVIMFHDDWIIYKGLEQLEKVIQSTSQNYRKYKISGCAITAFVFGEYINDFDNNFATACSPWEQFTLASEQRLKREILENQGNQA